MCVALTNPPPPTTSLGPPPQAATTPTATVRAATWRQRNPVPMSLNIGGLPVRDLNYINPVTAERHLDQQDNTPTPDRTARGRQSQRQQRTTTKRPECPPASCMTGSLATRAPFRAGHVLQRRGPDNRQRYGVMGSDLRWRNAAATGPATQLDGPGSRPIQQSGCEASHSVFGHHRLLAEASRQSRSLMLSHCRPPPCSADGDRRCGVRTAFRRRRVCGKADEPDAPAAGRTPLADMRGRPSAASVKVTVMETRRPVRRRPRNTVRASASRAADPSAGHIGERNRRGSASAIGRVASGNGHVSHNSSRGELPRRTPPRRLDRPRHRTPTGPACGACAVEPTSRATPPGRVHRLHLDQLRSGQDVAASSCSSASATVRGQRQFFQRASLGGDTEP